MPNTVGMETPLAARARHLPFLVLIATGGVTAVLGLLALAGWVTGSRVLAAFGPDLIPMAPSTAVLFLLHGASLVLTARPASGPLARRAARVLGVAGAAAALVLLVLSSLDVHPEFERLGMDLAGAMEGGAPLGHMSPVTAACFLLASASFLATLLRRPGRDDFSLPAVGCAGLVLIAALLFLLAYLYGEPLLSGGTFIPPALPTVLAFAVLGSGLVVLAVRQRVFSPEAAPGVRMSGFPVEAAVARPRGALDESEGRFRRTLDAMTEGFQILGRDWRYLYLNEAAAAQGRARREDLLGRTIFDCYPGFEQTRQFEVMRACMEDGVPRNIEDRFVFPDGSQIWFALRVHPAPEGISVLSLDISERKRNEARIAHLNAVLRGIRDVHQLLAREKDASGLLQGVCDRLVGTRGYRKAWVATCEKGSLRLRGHAGGEAAAFVRLAEELARGSVPHCAARALGPEGMVALRDPREECQGCPAAPPSSGVAILASRLEHEGVVHGVLVAGVPAEWADDPEERDLFREVAGDIASALYRIDLEQRHAGLEEQYRMAQRLESVGRLAGGVAHDFNNLMNIVLSYSGFVLDTLPADDPRREDLQEVRKAADRAVSLTRQLLAFSRKQVLKMEVLDLNQVVRGIEKMIGRLIGEDIEVRFHLAPDLGLVAADRGQVEQVLMNLVVNARDAMPRGGHLTIETQNVLVGEDYVAHHLSSKPGPHVLLSVSDDGVGMDAETKARIFEPFFTTKGPGQGTGLGLATVYGIVKQSGGNIWVYSEPGKGTTFKIYFPRVEATGRPTPAKPFPVVRPAAGTETILVVEDEEAVRRAAARILRAEGYTVVEAENGREALEVAGRHEGPIHLVLSDVVMPEMGGRELVERLRSLHPEVRAIYSSGYTDNAIQHQGVLEPGVNFIAKPFEAEALARLVREVLDRKDETTG